MQTRASSDENSEVMLGTKRLNVTPASVARPFQPPGACGRAVRAGDDRRAPAGVGRSVDEGLEQREAVRAAARGREHARLSVLE